MDEGAALTNDLCRQVDRAGKEIEPNEPETEQGTGTEFIGVPFENVPSIADQALFTRDENN